MFRNIQPAWLGLLMACTMTGCGGQQTAALLQDLQNSPYIPTKNTPDSDEAVEELFAVETDLELPSPDRVNPFEETAPAETASAGLRPQLKGFVEREQSQVVLTLGDRIAVIGEGETIDDVTILEIRPPQVVYRQRGVEHRLSL